MSRSKINVPYENVKQNQYYQAQNSFLLKLATFLEVQQLLSHIKYDYFFFSKTLNANQKCRLSTKKTVLLRKAIHYPKVVPYYNEIAEFDSQRVKYKQLIIQQLAHNNQESMEQEKSICEEQPQEAQELHDQPNSAKIKNQSSITPNNIPQKVYKKRGRKPKDQNGQHSKEKQIKNPIKEKPIAKKQAIQNNNKQLKKTPKLKNQNLGNTTNSDEPKPDPPKRSRYRFYMQTRFSQQYKPTYNFPNREDGRGAGGTYKDDLTTHYIHSFQSLCAYDIPTRDNASKQNISLKHIESMFLTSHGLNLLPSDNKPNETMHLGNLLSKIRQQNQDVRICLQVDKIKDSGKEAFNKLKDKGYYPIWMPFTTPEGKYKRKVTNEKQNKKQWEKSLGLLKAYFTYPYKQTKTLVFQRMKQSQQQFSFHNKIWLIKFCKKNQNKNNIKIRIVITSANLDNESQEFGTNMFWVQDYQYVQQGGVVLESDPYFDQLFDNINLNEDFIKTLDQQVLQKEKKWGFLKYLNIDLRKIKVKDINFVLIPSKPMKITYSDQTQLPDTVSLKKIQKFTKMYFQNTKGLENYISSQLHIITPDYLKCDQNLIYQLHKAFLNRQLQRQEVMNIVKVYYPTNSYVYNRIYEYCSYLDQESANELVTKILWAYFAQKEEHLKISYPITHYDKQIKEMQEANQDVGEQNTEQLLNQQERTEVNTQLFTFTSQKNANHRLKQCKHRRTQGFSPPHLKAYCVFFKRAIKSQNQQQQVEEKNILEKNIFCFGSHNATPAAWQKTKTINANPHSPKYQFCINNNELGMLFFDVPGLHSHVLPMTLDLSKKQTINSPRQQKEFKPSKPSFKSDKYTLVDTLEKGLMPLSKKQYQHLYNNTIKELDLKFNKYRYFLRNYIRQKTKRTVLLDYTLIQQVGTRCPLLNKFINNAEPRIKTAYQSLIAAFENGDLDQKRNKLIGDHNQLNPDAKFCFDNKLKVMMIADAVVVDSDGHVKEVWYIQTPHRRMFSKTLAQEIRKFFRAAGLQFYKLPNPQSFISSIQMGQEFDLYDSDLCENVFNPRHPQQQNHQ